MSKRQVVVTGLGMLCPLGVSVEEIWRKALAGNSGISSISEFDTSEFTTQFAGLVPDFQVTDYMSIKESRKCDLFVQYGIAAGVQAIKDSGLDLDDNSSLNLNRFGVVMGSGIGGISTIESSKEILDKSGPKRISPFFIPSCIINMISGHLAIKFGLKGPNLAVATACTTGTHCIGLAARTISYGDADVIVAGGAEKASTQLGLGGFAAARALSTRNQNPQQASRPWDLDRDGFVLGDGSGALVLEEYEHAKKRGAKIYAYLKGFGMTADAFHITRPSGIGAHDAMQIALKDAEISSDKINYINAHATSTQSGDIEESLAIKKVLGDAHSAKALVSSTKSMTGHLLGAAGAVEAIFSILALRDQIVPPTINLDQPDPKCVILDYVPHKAREANLEFALSNSFGFGGTNGSLIFQKF